MSTSHHSGPNEEFNRLLREIPTVSKTEEESAVQRLANQILRRTKEEFPDGRLNRQDEGELAFSIATDRNNKVVLVNFGKPVVWVGFPKEKAIQLANMILQHANGL